MKTKPNKPIKEETEDDTLLSDLENLDNNEDDASANASDDKDNNNEDDTVVTEEPEQNIVDMFIAGDMDVVKRHIHDKVVMTVSDVVNKPQEEESNSE